MANYTFGFIGTGNMGSALAKAAVKNVSPAKIILSNRTAARAEALAAQLSCAAGDVRTAAAQSDYIILGVKPQMMAGLLEDLAPVLAQRGDPFVLVTMAAGLTMERIADIPNMAGIKEACGNMEQICETMRRVRGKMDVYSGDDNLNVPILAIGGAGLISVVSNIAPKECKQVYEYMAAHDLDRANELEDKLLPLIDACFVEVNPIPVKYGCNVIGLEAGLPRPPLTELEDAHKKIMDKCIKNLGLKKV